MRAKAHKPFEVGDRVRLSVLGESRIRKPHSKVGKVVGYGFSEARVRVLFDGLSQPTTLHHSYLTKEQERARRGEPAHPARRSKVARQN
jgi:hypothetical protein